MAGDIDYEVYRLLSKRLTPDARVEYLVRWKGFSKDWDSWEPAESLGNCGTKIKNFERKTKEVTRKYVRKLVKRSKLNKHDPVRHVTTAMLPKKRGPGRPKKLLSMPSQDNEVSHLKSDLNLEETFTTVIKSPKSVTKQKKSARSPKEIAVLGKMKAFPKAKKVTSIEINTPRKYVRKNVNNKIIAKSDNISGAVNIQKQGRQKKAESMNEFRRKSLTKTADGQAEELVMSQNAGKISVKRKYTKRQSFDKKGASRKLPSKAENAITLSSTPMGQLQRPDHGETIVGQKIQGKIAVKHGFKMSKKSDSMKRKRNADRSSLSLSEKSRIIKHKKISKAHKGKHKNNFKISVSQLIKTGQSKAFDPTHIDIDTDNESSDDEILYSLASGEPTESGVTLTKDNIKDRSKSDSGVKGEIKSQEIRKKKMKKFRNKSDGLDVLNSQQLGIRLLDSLKTSVAKPVRPVSPTPLFSNVNHSAATATILPSAQPHQPQWGVRDVSPTTDAASDEQASLPLSPATMSYKVLLENLPRQLHPKKSSKKILEETEEDVERRISVRATECAYKYKEILIKKCHRFTQIWLNTHTTMKNALNPLVMQEITSALNAAKYDDSSLVMLSGLGNVFCSGLDLHFLTSGDRKMAARQMGDALRDLVRKFTTFPKLIVAVVTGPAIGLGTAILPLCDMVYASDKATFYLPYGQLAQTPEGCASYTLPQCCGVAMASELLIAGRKVTAIEACQLGLVSQVYWPTSMMQEVIPKVQHMALLSGKASETTKLLIRSHQRTKLDLTNESECNLLVERWPTAECQKAMEEFLCNEKNYTL